MAAPVTGKVLAMAGEGSTFEVSCEPIKDTNCGVWALRRSGVAWPGPGSMDAQPPWLPRMVPGPHTSMLHSPCLSYLQWDTGTTPAMEEGQPREVSDKLRVPWAHMSMESHSPGSHSHFLCLITSGPASPNGQGFSKGHQPTSGERPMPQGRSKSKGTTNT